MSESGPLFPWTWSVSRPDSDVMGMLTGRGGVEGRGDQGKEQRETQEADPSAIRLAVG